jgi:hypothetical protein
MLTDAGAPPGLSGAAKESELPMHVRGSAPSVVGGLSFRNENRGESAEMRSRQADEGMNALERSSRAPAPAPKIYERSALLDYILS